MPLRVMVVRFATALAIFALIGSGLLLATDSPTGRSLSPWASVIASLPLLTVDISFLVVQAMEPPRRAELLKNLLLAAAFLLWGVELLMTRDTVSKTLSDFVIALYVIDLAWTVLASTQKFV